MIEKAHNYFEKIINPFSEIKSGNTQFTVISSILLLNSRIKWLILLVVTIGIVFVISELALFNFFGEIVQWLIERQATKSQISLVDPFFIQGFFWLVTLLISLHIYTQLVNQTLSQNIHTYYCRLFYKCALDKDIDFHQRYPPGLLSNHLWQACGALRDLVIKGIDVVTYFIAYTIGLFLIFLNQDILLSILFLVWLIVFCIFIVCYVPRMSLLSSKASINKAEYVGVVVDSFRNLSIIKSYCYSKSEIEFNDSSLNKVHHSSNKVHREATNLNLYSGLMNWGLFILVIVSLMDLWIREKVEIGIVAASIPLILRLITLSQWVLSEAGSIFLHIGVVQSALSTLSQNNIETISKVDDKLDLSSLDIKLSRVQFAYNNVPIFHDINLRIKQGDQVVIVGPSGSGKSTLINLLLRFADHSSGEITIGGINIRDIPVDFLRSQIAIISQNAYLFNRTIRDNLLVGNPDCSSDDVNHILKTYHMEDFVNNLDDGQGGYGLNFMVADNGDNLSGGQRQRLSIARALLKDAPILIIDEATSSLDAKARENIDKLLLAKSFNKTVIKITHLLHEIHRGSIIYELKNGVMKPIIFR